MSDDNTRERAIDVLAAGTTHHIRDNFDGGYRCTGCSLTWDWMKAEEQAAVRHEAGMVVDALVAAGFIRETDNTGNDAKRDALNLIDEMPEYIHEAGVGEFCYECDQRNRLRDLIELLARSSGGVS